MPRSEDARTCGTACGLFGVHYVGGLARNAGPQNEEHVFRLDTGTYHTEAVSPRQQAAARTFVHLISAPGLGRRRAER